MVVEYHSDIVSAARLSLALPLSSWMTLSKIYLPSRYPRSSSDDRTFRIPTFKRKQHGGRAFCFSAVQTWNSLPLLSIIASLYLPSKLVLK